MNLGEARNVVYRRKSELEKQLSDGPSPYERRLILLNLNSCDQMLMYLHLIAIGRSPTFKVLPAEPNAVVQDKIVEA